MNIQSSILTFESCFLRHPLQRQRLISLSRCGWPVGMDGELSITKDQDDYLHTYIRPYIPLHRMASPDEVRADHDSEEDPSAASQYRSLAPNHISITR
jgi:hypothetical protein